MLSRLLTAVVRPAFETLRQEEEVRRAPWTLVKSYGAIGLVSYLVLSHFSNKETAEKTTKNFEEIDALKTELENVKNSAKSHIQAQYEASDAARQRIDELEERLEGYEHLAGVIEVEKEKVRQRRRLEEAKAIVEKYERAKATVAASGGNGRSDKPYDGVGT